MIINHLHYLKEFFNYDVIFWYLDYIIMSYESPKYSIGNLYASIAKDALNHWLFMDLFASIAMDVKKIKIIYKTYM